METPRPSDEPRSPEAAPPEDATGAVVPRGRRLRVVLAVAGGVVALLCLGGVGIAFVLYDDATKIDRSSPDMAVDNYLRAFLVKRDDAEAALFGCKDRIGLAPLFDLRSDLTERERRYAIRIVVSWTSLDTEISGDEATVSTDVRRSIADGSERISDRWRFRVVDEGGWRVCSAAKIG